MIFRVMIVCFSGGFCFQRGMNSYLLRMSYMLSVVLNEGSDCVVSVGFDGSLKATRIYKT